MPTEREQKSLRELIQRVLDEAPFSMRQIAEEAGISYDAIRSWATERRTARPENVAQLASALERRSERLHLLAAELRDATENEK
jgi:transcriptional regulator with XRE-family HTH domain